MPSEPVPPSESPEPSDDSGHPEPLTQTSIADVIAPLKARRDQLTEHIARLVRDRDAINKTARDALARVTSDAKRDRKTVNVQISEARAELEKVTRFLNAEHPRKRTPKAVS